MADPLHMSEIPEEQLRAWADARVISSARYVEEMQRRKTALILEPAVTTVDVPSDVDVDIDGFWQDDCCPDSWQGFGPYALFFGVGGLAVAFWVYLCVVVFPRLWAEALARLVS